MLLVWKNNVIYSCKAWGRVRFSQLQKENLKVLMWEENSLYQNEQSISKWMSEVTMMQSTTCEKIFIESYFGDTGSMKFNSIFSDDNLHNRYVISIVKWEIALGLECIIFLKIHSQPQHHNLKRKLIMPKWESNNDLEYSLSKRYSWNII